MNFNATVKATINDRDLTIGRWMRFGVEEVFARSPIMLKYSPNDTSATLTFQLYICVTVKSFT